LASLPDTPTAYWQVVYLRSCPTDAYVIPWPNCQTPRRAIYAHLAGEQGTLGTVHRMFERFAVASRPLPCQGTGGTSCIWFGGGFEIVRGLAPRRFGGHSMILQGGLWTCVSHVYVAASSGARIYFHVKSAFVPYR
jgi:hypothetical protein